MAAKNVVCFGEVLWDLLPSGKKIGGAPLNVALRLKSLGVPTAIISRVGNDDDGRDIIDYVRNSGVEPLIQVDKILQTGMVDVKIDNSGNASYDIRYPSAWDSISYEESLSKTIKNIDVFIYGSLVCRSEKSASTLFNFLEKANFKVMDVNLRKPHYSIDMLLALMEKADFIKLNEEELDEICEGAAGESITKKIKILSEKTKTDHICVTKGAQGVILFHQGRFFHNSGFYIKVKDTVGAGDSFLAAYVAQLLQKQKPSNALDFVCAMGSMVASKEGANSTITDEEVKRLMWFD